MAVVFVFRYEGLVFKFSKMKKTSVIFIVLIIALVGASIFLFSTITAQELPFCGDGIVQSPNAYGELERCDDGNTVSGDGCTAGVSASGANPNGCWQETFGWAWSANIGWVSLSCYNQGTCGDVPYWVSITSEDPGQVEGWAWSPNVGWVCFGDTCETVPWYVDTTSPFTNLTTSIDESSKEVFGWSWYTTLNDDGWISLNCDNPDISADCSVSDYQVSAVNKDFCAYFEGNETACQAQGCDYDLESRACSGGETRLSLSGFSWSPKAGWLQFDPVIDVVPPWLQTRFGDIYTLGGISADAPNNRFTATFRILANGGIASAIRSQQGNEITWINPEFGPIDFPTPDTQYSNILGQLNIEDLTSCPIPLEPLEQECLNQFGQTVKKIDAITDIEGIADITSYLEEPLGGKIYHFENDGDISSFELSNYTFSNASGFGNGAGTIVIEGDLAINSDVAYASSAPDVRFRNLASVASVIKGDLKIAPAVNSLDGNFIVLGNGTTASPNNCSLVPEEEVPGCGQIHTCYQDPENPESCNNQLTVSGMMMARKFLFNRTFIDEDRGSELIIYDGRLLANTPPGLADFAKALPIWRSGTFSQ